MIKRSTLARIGFVLVLICILGMMALLLGCASTQAGKSAQSGIHADHATTAVGVGLMGATELNPLAPLGPLRYLAVRHAEGMRCEDGGAVLRTASTVGWGAAGWNILMLAAGPVPAVLGGIMGGLGGYQSSDCEPIPATEAQIALLEKWERAYESGDTEVMSALMDNPELLSAYENMIQRTESRSVEYTRAEKVRGGFIVRYRARWVYPGGTEKVSEGDVRFRLNRGVIVDVG